MNGLMRVAGLGLLVVGCGAAGSTINVDVTVSGDGVEQAIIERGGETQTVDLPWSTTVTVEDEAGTDAFTVIATNPTEAGELRCDADWREASSDGTWARSASYQVSCGARVSFRDGGTVRLEPTGRSITFEERDATLAAEAAELAAEAERLATVAAARSDAMPEGAEVRVGDWDVAVTGVLRDAEDYIEDLTGSRVSGSGVTLIAEVTGTYQGSDSGEARDLAFTLIGGRQLDQYATFDASCGAIPAPAFEMAPAAPGESVAFNVCWQVHESEIADAFIEVDQFGVGVDAEPVRLLLPATDGLGGTAGEAQTGAVQVGPRWRIEVTEVTVDDLDAIRQTQEDAEPTRDGRAYIRLVMHIDNVGEDPGWPALQSTDWFIVATDGVTRYDDGVGDRCPRFPSPLTTRQTSDPLLEPGESVVLDHCWDVEAEHVEGATLLVRSFGEEAVFDLGL